MGVSRYRNNVLWWNVFGLYALQIRISTAFASASNHLDIKLGALNTGVLILSSLTMALAVYFTQIGKRQPQILCLILTLVLGLTFLGVKAVEYKDKYDSHLIPGYLIPSHPFGPEIAEGRTRCWTT